MSKLNRTEAYVVLNLLPQVGPRRLARLLEAFGAPEDALAAGRQELARVPGLGREVVDRILNWQKLADPTEELRLARELGAEIVTRDDPYYPPLLREIYDPPILLFTLGRLSERERHSLGIVGSRGITPYGQDCTRRFAYSLAKAGYTITSGLALGVDTEAHKAALAAGGRTVAVIGSGLGHIYPPENRELARRIAEGNGAVVSEFPLRQRPEKTTFPLRNRIISGMSEGLLVVEAGQRSGALITASQAVEQNRAVFAVPGPINAGTSMGCNRLIQEGARLALEPADLLSELSTLVDGADRAASTLRSVPGYPTSDRRRNHGQSAGAPLEPELALEMELEESKPAPMATPAPAPPVPEARPARRKASSAPPGPIVVRPLPELEAREEQVLALLGVTPVGADLLIERSGLNIAQLSSILMSLEMKHLARQLPGGMYARQ